MLEAPLLFHSPHVLPLVCKGLLRDRTLICSSSSHCRLTGSAGDPHKPLFPLSWEDWVGYCFAAISLFIAAGGGIGGGGILVPLYILLLGALLPSEN